MDSVRTAINKCWSDAPNDDVFIQQLDDLIDEHGNYVCPLIFRALTSLKMPIEQSVESWSEVKRYRQQLITKLGRNVSLVTAISDYLTNSSIRHSQLRLIESGTLERAVRDTTHDFLTGLYNRTYFDEIFNQQVNYAKRYNSSFSVLFLDLDDFKEINDNLGHFAGDEALKTVANIINSSKRESDVSSRFGGEEFVLLMPNTDCADGLILAERVRKAIEQKTFSYQGKEFNLTISGGLASYPHHTSDPGDLLIIADSAVYLAKGAGKNSIMPYKKEKRRYLRTELYEPLLIEELNTFTVNRISAMSKNIGMGGMLFTCDKNFEIDTILKIRLSISENRTFLIFGRVVRVIETESGKFDVGISMSFKEMAKTANQEISLYLKDKLSEGHQLPLFDD